MQPTPTETKSQLNRVVEKFKMNTKNFELCAKIIPSSYVHQAQNAKKSLENQIKAFLEHVSAHMVV